MDNEEDISLPFILGIGSYSFTRGKSGKLKKIQGFVRGKKMKDEAKTIEKLEKKVIMLENCFDKAQDYIAELEAKLAEKDAKNRR